MSSDSMGNELDPHGRQLDDAFFGGKAAAERARLTLQAEDRAARDLIAEATGITDTDLLAELAGLGIRVETLSALTLIPLVEVAWADGVLDDAERHAVLAGAVSTGIEPGSGSHRLLEIWTQDRPSPLMEKAWSQFVGALVQKLDGDEVPRLQENILRRAYDVAAATGDLLGHGSNVSDEEEETLEKLAKVFSA